MKTRDTKVVWKRDIDCGGVIYQTSITKPNEDAEKEWQIALHVKVNGFCFHDYRTHFIEGSGQWDGEVLNEQIMFVYARLFKNMPELNDNSKIWYREMLYRYFTSTDFDFK